MERRREGGREGRTEGGRDGDSDSARPLASRAVFGFLFFSVHLDVDGDGKVSHSLRVPSGSAVLSVCLSQSEFTVPTSSKALDNRTCLTSLWFHSVPCSA